MLKHVQHTALSRRPSKDVDYFNDSCSGSPPPSPTPSSISSCTTCSSFNMSPSSSSTSSTVSTSTSNGESSSSVAGVTKTTTACLIEDANANNGCPSYHHHPTTRSISLDEFRTGSGSAGYSTWRPRKRSLAFECGMKSSSSRLGSASGKSGSCLSIASNSSSMLEVQQENSIPLRVYARCLRPDIQYKTIGITSSTTAKEVVDMLFLKCKLPFKDPKLFYLSLDMRIRNANGTDVDASIPLESDACPFKLQECYPTGREVKFSLQMSTTGSLVKIYDKTGVLGWDYKGVMISERTTAGELIDILFRFNSIIISPSTSESSSETSSATATATDNVYTLHVEVDEEWNQKLEPTDMIIPMLSIATQFGTSTKLILKSQPSSSGSEESSPLPTGSQTKRRVSPRSHDLRFTKQSALNHGGAAVTGVRASQLQRQKPIIIRKSTTTSTSLYNLPEQSCSTSSSSSLTLAHHLNQYRNRYSTLSLSTIMNSTTTDDDEEDNEDEEDHSSTLLRSPPADDCKWVNNPEYYWTATTATSRRRRRHSLSSSSGGDSSSITSEDLMLVRRLRRTTQRYPEVDVSEGGCGRLILSRFQQFSIVNNPVNSSNIYPSSIDRSNDKYNLLPETSSDSCLV